MKKNRIMALLLCVLLTLCCMNIPAIAAEQTDDGVQIYDSSVSEGCHTPDGRYAIHGTDNLLQYTSSAILYEVTSDTLVYAYNADQQMYPSSLVKIMTALLAIENGDLSDTVTASRQALDSVSLEALRAGLYGAEELTLEELLYVMMVGSANDACAVIAEHIAGSQQGFVNLMNQRAAELGCTGTVFVNATGLHDPAQVTTARDMVKILRKAMEYPAFAEIFGTTSYTLRATNKSEERSFRTTNNMMLTHTTLGDYYDSRVTGGRTGVTDDDLRCLAITAQDGDALYIAVVLGSKPGYTDGVLSRYGSFEDMKTMMELAFSKSRLVQLFYEDQIMRQVSVVNGTNDVAIGPDCVVSCVLPAGYTEDDLTTRIVMNQNVLNAPVEYGMSVAQCQIWYGNICVAQSALFAKNTVSAVVIETQPDPTGEDSGFDAGSLTTALIVLGVIFVVIVVIFGGLFLVRIIRSWMRKSRSRKRRQERRRSK